MGDDVRLDDDDPFLLLLVVSRRMDMMESWSSLLLLLLVRERALPSVEVVVLLDVMVVDVGPKTK